MLNVKEMYGLLYLILLKNIIDDILGIAILLSPHIKIKHIPVDTISKKYLIKGFGVIKRFKEAQSRNAVLRSFHYSYNVIILIQWNSCEKRGKQSHKRQKLKAFQLQSKLDSI